MKRLTKVSRLFVLMAVTVIIIPVTGCNTTPDPGNKSARPWNQPKHWESGAPGLLQPDRRY
ncbi:MAG: hypothetical protein CMO80_17465 [Verrucomicrobiales bacterium]|nr:hypothetical protein [Verrucomicrobiales bacterium]|tara:strand:- start:4521 stop:4703 length:183 start_codon:yes stop_codon:yes gene_type:complete